MLHACGLELEDLAAYAIHKDSQTIKKYARRNPIHLHRRVARADTLSTVIEGLYDPEAAARGALSVRWFLGYDADGAPQFCGLPAHHPAPTEWTAHGAVCSSAASEPGWSTTIRMCSGSAPKSR